MGKKWNLSNSECGMIIGARWAGLSMSETADLLGFSLTSISLGFTENGPKMTKYPVSSSCVDKNAMLMTEESGQTGLRR